MQVEHFESAYIYLFTYLLSIYLTLTVKITLLTFENGTSFVRRATITLNL